MLRGFDNIEKGILGAIILIAVVTWGAIFYTAAHFIAKWW